MLAIEIAQDLRSLINKITEKDWKRAANADPAHIELMLRSIKEPNMLIGRVLALYFTYKFLFPWITDLGEQKVSTLIDLLNPYVAEELLEQIKRLSRKDVQELYTQATLPEWLADICEIPNKEQEPQPLEIETYADPLEKCELELKDILKKNNLPYLDIYFEESVPGVLC